MFHANAHCIIIDYYKIFISTYYLIKTSSKDTAMRVQLSHLAGPGAGVRKGLEKGSVI